MATQSKSRSKSNGNGNGQRQQSKRQQPAKQDDSAFGASSYEETPGWGTAFHRPDNEAPQPAYTGEGVLDVDTLKAIHAAGGEFQIAIWPRRTRNGSKTLRIHIEPPYQGSEDADLDDDEFDGPAAEADDDDGTDDDLPF